MDERELLFELILWVDKTTVELRRKVDSTLQIDEYNHIRSKHYSNMKKLSAVGLSEAYYDYLYEHCIKPTLLQEGSET